MAGTTARLALPYPSPPDPADVPADIKALADKLDPMVASLTATAQQTFAATLAAPAAMFGNPNASDGPLTVGLPNLNSWAFSVHIPGVANGIFGVFGQMLYWSGPASGGPVNDVWLTRRDSGSSIDLATGSKLVSDRRVVGSAASGTFRAELGDVFSSGAGVSFGSPQVTGLYANFPVGDPSLTNWTGAAFGAFVGSAFTVGSDKSLKADARKIDAEQDRVLVETMLAANVWTYKLRGAGTERHLGLMADELPEHVVHDMQHPPTRAKGSRKDAEEWDPREGETLQAVDLYKLSAALLATVQHLEDRVAGLEAGAAVKPA